MDILAVCGSPRKNRTTHSVLNAVIDGTGLQSEILFPAFMNIKHCVGCLACKNKTPGKCWQEDDMQVAIDKLFEANALILASPTYFGNVPGPMKNFIDRSIPTCYTGKGDPWLGAANHGTRPLKGTPALMLVVSGGGDHEKTAANIRLVLEYYEYNIIAAFVEPMAGAIVSEKEHPDIYRELYGMGEKLKNAVEQTKKQSPR